MKSPYLTHAACLLVSILLTAFSPACYAEVGPWIDAEIPSYAAQDSLSGRLTISVSDAMEALVQAWADNFMRQYPDLQIVTISDRSHAGHTRLLAQEADLMATSRRMTPTEVGNWLLEFGEKPIAVPVAHHPQTVSVRNDGWIGYGAGPVTRLRVNAMVGDGSTALMARSARTVAPPFRGSVYLYRVNRRQANPTPVSAELIRYALSRQGQELALERGYVPLSFEEIRRVTSRRPASER
ncbi:MAG TPA: hypothetical protein DDY39_01920 [Nitrospira sp.]|nr:hypothetical protein [Nitrospira sp.]